MPHTNNILATWPECYKTVQEFGVWCLKWQHGILGRGVASARTCKALLHALCNALTEHYKKVVRWLHSCLLRALWHALCLYCDPVTPIHTFTLDKISSFYFQRTLWWICQHTVSILGLPNSCLQPIIQLLSTLKIFIFIVLLFYSWTTI